MSNRANGRKKSLFPAQTTVLTNASMDYFVNGVNYKIPYANFVSGLGVTGSLVQDGAADGVPVLNTQGSVNNIRNLEPGSGISASISAEDGITLKHNFTQDTTGSPVLVNPTATSPAIASIVAGSGISVTAASNNITIAASGVAKPSKQILISVVGDLPSAVANVITLVANTEYLILQSISIGANRLVMSEGTVLAGLDNTLVAITYTGTGDMITSGDKNFVVKDIALTCANGRAFKVTDTSAKTIGLRNITITTCTKVGIFVSTASDYTLNNVNSNDGVSACQVKTNRNLFENSNPCTDTLTTAENLRAVQTNRFSCEGPVLSIKNQSGAQGHNNNSGITGYDSKFY